MRRRGPCPALGPSPRDLVLLADPGLVGKPELYVVDGDALLARDLRQARRESFLKRRSPRWPGHDGAGGPRACGSPWRAVPGSASARRPDAELLPDPLAEIDEPPAHHPVDRPASDRSRSARPAPARCSVVSRGVGPGALRSIRPVRTIGVELHHPVADDLHGHAADPRRLAPRRSFIDRRQRQKPPRLRPILRPLCRRRQAVASKSSRSPIAAAMANFIHSPCRIKS